MIIVHLKNSEIRFLFCWTCFSLQSFKLEDFMKSTLRTDTRHKQCYVNAVISICRRIYIHTLTWLAPTQKETPYDNYKACINTLNSLANWYSWELMRQLLNISSNGVHYRLLRSATQVSFSLSSNCEKQQPFVHRRPYYLQFPNDITLWTIQDNFSIFNKDKEIFFFYWCR